MTAKKKKKESYFIYCVYIYEFIVLSRCTLYNKFNRILDYYFLLCMVSTWSEYSIDQMFFFSVHLVLCILFTFFKTHIWSMLFTKRRENYATKNYNKYVLVMKRMEKRLIVISLMCNLVQFSFCLTIWKFDLNYHNSVINFCKLQL